MTSYRRNAVSTYVRTYVNPILRQIFFAKYHKDNLIAAKTFLSLSPQKQLKVKLIYFADFKSPSETRWIIHVFSPREKSLPARFNVNLFLLLLQSFLISRFVCNRYQAKQLRYLQSEPTIGVVVNIHVAFKVPSSFGSHREGEHWSTCCPVQILRALSVPSSNLFMTEKVYH